MTLACSALFFMISVASYAQDTGNPFNRGRVDNNTGSQGDAFNNNVINPEDKPPIELYKIISVKRDNTNLDTTLTMAKDFKFN